MSLPTIPNSFHSFESEENKQNSSQVAQPVFGHHSQDNSQRNVFRNHSMAFLGKNKKLLLGGLTLPLLMIAVGVGVRLVGEKQDLRQQASGEDSGWIVFTAMTSTGTTQIFSMKEDNSDFRVLSSEINGESSKQASFSPDGNKIVYSSNKSGSWNIYMIDANGGNEEQLTTDGGAFFPSFSSDGTKVVYVFQSSIEPVLTSQIRVKTLGGSISLLTSDITGRVHNPIFSVDGTKIIFSSSYMGGIFQLFFINVVENGEVSINKLTTSGGKHPSILDNNNIVFVAENNGVDQIYSIGVDGQNLTQLTFDTISHHGYPVRSPDGNHIAYVAFNVEEIVPTIALTPTSIPSPTVGLTIAPTQAEESCEGQCLGFSDFECPGGSSVCRLNAFGQCAWACEAGDVIGVNTSNYQIVIENLDTGEAWEFSQPHLWQNEYVDSSAMMLSPNAWMVPSDGDKDDPVPDDNCTIDEDCLGEKVCNPEGECVDSLCMGAFDDCDDGNECTFNECHNPGKYNSLCSNPIKDDNILCSVGVCLAGECVTIEDPYADEPIDLGDDISLFLTISFENVPYCEGDICYHPLQTHPIFFNGERSINAEITLVHAIDGSSKQNTYLQYDEEERIFRNADPMVFSGLSQGPYIILVKGSMHLTTWFCYSGASAANQCTFADLVDANNNYPSVIPDFIYLQPGEISLDLSAKPIIVGDFPISGEARNTQDGRANISDYSFLLSCLGNNSRTTFCLTRADTDYSGQVNNIDLGLLRKTLTEVVDEE